MLIKNLLIPKWITVALAAELTGYSSKALNQKIDKGQLPYGVVWINAPDNRRMINLQQFMRWLEGDIET